MKGQTNKRIRAAQLQRSLRNRPTDAEARLWQHLKRRQIDHCKFRRQHPFADYILDFACLERRVVVELDGGQHVDAADYDARRSRLLEGAGFLVLRFWNNDVFVNLPGVLEVIHGQLVARRTTCSTTAVASRRTPSPPKSSP